MGHPIHKHMNSGMSRASSAEKYDAKEAYNKDLSSKARMHYLENDIADKKGMSRQASPLNIDGGKAKHEKHIGRKLDDHTWGGHTQTEKHHRGPSRNASPLNDFKGGYHKVQHAKGEAHKSPASNMQHDSMGDKAKHQHMMKEHPAKPPTSRYSSPANNITYGDKSGPTGYIGEQRADDMKYNPVDDRAGISRYKSDAQRKAVHASKADGGMSRQKYGGNKGDEKRSATKDYDSPASIRKAQSTRKTDKY